ncbi:MAG: PH domain-containing protein [Alphaproteobacteria bacterium]|nr:PH domain-containing protein [Alphaproteobacteria bacterium]
MLAIGHLHWIIYKDALGFLLIALATFWIGQKLFPNDAEFRYAAMAIGAGLVFLAFVNAVAMWFKQWITEMAVTNRRVIYKHGFIMRHTAEMNMNKIESVTVSQSIIGRLLNYGTVHIRGTGEGLEHLHKISRPVALRNSIVAR